MTRTARQPGTRAGIQREGGIATAARRRTRVVLALMFCLLAPWSFAQTDDTRVQVRTSEAPHHLGQAIVIQIAVQGFERNPDPRVDVMPVPDATLSLLSISPRTSESITVVNGQMNRSVVVQHVFRFHLTPGKAGPVSVGPFRFTQGSREAIANAMTFNVVEVPSSRGYRLELRLPQRAIWVGEQFPVTLEWWIERAKGDAVGARLATVPLFERDDLFRFGEPEPANTRQTIRIQVSGRATDFPATVDLRQDGDGQDFYVLSVTRPATALKAGTHNIEAPTILVEETVRWQRDLFNQRVPTQVQRVKTDGKPLSLRITTPPAKGRPSAFAGIIGKGFSLASKVGRSVVNVGDPIELELTINGDGPLDTLALPDAAALGLDPDRFSVAAGAAAGTLAADGSKQFKLNVRALSPDVDAIPALSIAWFDPATQKYATASSAPIALSVKPAVVVGADAVVVPEPSAPSATASSRGAGATPANAPVRGALDPTTQRPAEFSELAIETRPALLLRENARWYLVPWVQAGIYVISALTLGGAAWWRRHQRRDRAAQARETRFRTRRQAIEQATTADVIAQELRAMVAAAARISDRPLLDSVLERCDAVQFGRGEARTDVKTLRDDALRVAEAIEAAG